MVNAIEHVKALIAKAADARCPEDAALFAQAANNAANALSSLSFLTNGDASDV